MVRVLVVEDDPDLRLLLEDVLVEAGHDCVGFGNAESALTWVEKGGRAPLMVLDWILPGMDGLELCRRVRAMRLAETPVVMVITAHTEPDRLSLILDAGADDYLAKPFSVHYFEVRLTIAERHAANLRIHEQAEANARESARLQGALLAANTVEHHLGNQLALTMGYTELLAADGELPERATRQAQLALDGVQRATETLSKLRSITKLEPSPMTGPASLDLERCLAK